MTRRRRPRTAQERVIGVLGTVAPGSLGGRIRNTRPAVVLQPNTGGPPPDAGVDPATLSRISVANFAPAAITAASWHFMTFGSTEEVVGTDLTLSSGNVTANADGIYTFTVQVNWIGASPALPAGTHCAVDAGAYLNLDAYFRTENDPTQWGNAPVSTTIFPPYFLAAGTTLHPAVAVVYAGGGGPCAPSGYYLSVQRVA